MHGALRGIVGGPSSPPFLQNVVFYRSLSAKLARLHHSCALYYAWVIGVCALLTGVTGEVAGFCRLLTGKCQVSALHKVGKSLPKTSNCFAFFVDTHSFVP